MGRITSGPSLAWVPSSGLYYDSPTLPWVPGGCFNKHDRPSDQATGHSAMDKRHGMIVRHPVGQSIMLIETAPLVLGIITTARSMLWVPGYGNGSYYDWKIGLIIQVSIKGIKFL